MRGLLQRVSHAEVVVADALLGKIGHGILLLLAIEKQDNTTSVDKLLNKVVTYRLFADDQGHMNLSLNDVGGELLIVSQFTLAADTSKGLRPSFAPAAPPDLALALYTRFVEQAKLLVPHVATGQFGADMQVSLVNDGPVTFNLAV